MLKIKKFITTLMVLAIMFILPFQSFADTKEDQMVFESQTVFIDADADADISTRASVTGRYGTAYIGYMSNARMLNWRLTGSKMIANFTGTISVTRLSGTPVRKYYVSGSGMSPNGQINVSSLKKGTYLATFSGTGKLVSGKSFYILPGLHENFTKY